MKQRYRLPQTPHYVLNGGIKWGCICGQERHFFSVAFLRWLVEADSKLYEICTSPLKPVKINYCKYLSRSGFDVMSSQRFTKNNWHLI